MLLEMSWKVIFCHCPLVLARKWQMLKLQDSRTGQWHKLACQKPGIFSKTLRCDKCFLVNDFAHVLLVDKSRVNVHLKPTTWLFCIYNL